MHIVYFEGSVFDQDVTQVIMHGVNAQGKMGSGVAKIVRERFPTAYKSYVNWYYDEKLPLGAIQVVPAEEDKIIINAVTQENFGYDGKRYVSYDAIASAIQKVDFWAKTNNVVRVAMPMIGAGLGGGNWETISKIIEENAVNFTPCVFKI